MKKKQSFLKTIIHKEQCDKIPESVKWSIIVGCILFDCVCFYTSYNLVLRQNFVLNLLTVMVSAVTMDFFPVVIAMLLSRSEKNRMETGMAITIAVAFLSEAALSFAIRYNTRDLLFESGGLGFILSSQAAQNITPETSETTMYARIGIVILLGIIPILTSLLSFSVSYENPVRRKQEKRKEILVDLKEQINNHQVNIDLLEEELDKRNLLKLDQTRFKVASILVDLVEVGSQIKEGHIIAAKLSDVDATTLLTEDPDIQDKIEHIRKDLDQLIEETDYNEDGGKEI